MCAFFLGRGSGGLFLTQALGAGAAALEAFIWVGEYWA